VKNQLWLIERLPVILQRHPNVVLVLAGAITERQYGEAVQRRVRELALENHVFLTGGLAPGDARLIGLMQSATAVVLPSISETFGLVILEAWAARTAVLSSRTSGGCGLVRPGENGWLFDLDADQTFMAAVDELLADPARRQRLAEAGHRLAVSQFDTKVIARSVCDLYAELIEEKHALRHYP
jgi:glycosyltransferase involved in cell wall biosynthesis